MKSEKNKDANIVESFMDVCTAIKERRSIRAFLDKAVQPEIINSILEVARWAPSGVNHQPWHVCVLGQNSRRKLGERIIEARESHLKENPDYEYYPKVWEEPYKSRRKACGKSLYGALNIQYDDTEKRKEQWYKNYHFFGAPVGMIIYLDSKLSTGSWLDLGSFLQSLMVSARGFGLETCAQASLAEYPDIVRETLDLPDNFAIACGLSLGFADWDHPVNNYRVPREDLSEFVKWLD